jgi:predicted transcriptional regulator
VETSDISSKRQLIFASLLRFAPTSVPLRDRIIDDLTLAGLVGSSSDKPLTVGMILSNVFAGSKNSLRVQRVQEALQRLKAKGYVEFIENKKKKHSYYLLEEGRKQAHQSVETVETIFDASLRRVLKDIEHCCPYETAAEVCRNFLLECFSRFGVQMAKSVTGQIQPGDLLRQADVQAAFQAAASKSKITGTAAESLYARCIEILKSTHPDDVKLRFLITQGYYFAQLAEYGDSAFNPLLKESYSDSMLILDTNVVLLAVQDSVSRRVFDELLKVAKQLNIKLAITRATQHETLGALESHRDSVREILLKAPEQLVRLSGDELVDAYLERRQAVGSIAVDEFFKEAKLKVHSLAEAGGIIIINLDEDSILGNREFKEAEEIIQEEAERSRGWRKPPATLKHDVAHYTYVLDARFENPKTWFLTRDHGLPLAAARLATEGQRPFTFDLTVLLETVSPFVSSAEPNSQLSSVLATLISENLIPKTSIFNVYELKLLVEMHEDVLSTPAEQLVRAVDYVKHAILSGETYSPSKYNEVALGLRSFIASSADEQRRELEAQRASAEAGRQQQLQLATEERNRREAQEKLFQEKLRQFEEVQDEHNQQAQRIVELESHIASQAQEIQSLSTPARSWNRVQLLATWVWLVSGFLLLFTAEANAGKIAGYIQWKIQWHSHWHHLALAVKLIAATNFVLSAAYLASRKANWQLQARASVVAVAILASIFICKLFDADVPIYSLAALALLIATACVALFQES